MGRGLDVMVITTGGVHAAWNETLLYMSVLRSLCLACPRARWPVPSAHEAFRDPRRIHSERARAISKWISSMGTRREPLQVTIFVHIQSASFQAKTPVSDTLWSVENGLDFPAPLCNVVPWYRSMRIEDLRAAHSPIRSLDWLSSWLGGRRGERKGGLGRALSTLAAAPGLPNMLPSLLVLGGELIILAKVGRTLLELEV